MEDSGNDDSFENIGATDLAHEGKDHGSYNGQADHNRKYPKGFGNAATILAVSDMRMPTP